MHTSHSELVLHRTHSDSMHDVNNHLLKFKFKELILDARRRVLRVFPISHAIQCELKPSNVVLFLIFILFSDKMIKEIFKYYNVHVEERIYFEFRTKFEEGKTERNAKVCKIHHHM